MITEQYQHRAEIRSDVIAWDEPIVFRWHWPRGTFDKRMSALEIATFVLPHMPSILPFLDSHPRMYAEFQAMLVKLAISPREVIDEVLPWIKTVVRTADWDYIELSISFKQVQERTQLVSYRCELGRGPK